MPADRLFHPRLGHSEKVCALSHLEFRVWATYELTADDYGVMRKSAVTLQAANDALAREKPKVIEEALQRLVTGGLLRVFEHQGRTYVYQDTWQNYQRVKHPRDTMQPAPSLEQLALCSPATQKLFAQNHPTFVISADKVSETDRKDFGNISEMDRTEKSELGSLARTRGRETANGLRLTANGKEGVQGDFPGDLWFAELQAAYPPSAVSGGHLTQTAFIDAVVSKGAPLATFTAMLANLENQKRGHQWRVKNMIPRLDRWLREGLWQQQHEEAPASVLLTDKTARTLEAAAAVKRLGR